MKLVSQRSKEGLAGSLPVRECGLKFFVNEPPDWLSHVTPRAGVWIEMGRYRIIQALRLVTPRAGVWIEIAACCLRSWSSPSLPVRECGLKFVLTCGVDTQDNVTPRAGVWIEMSTSCGTLASAQSLPVRECGLKSIHRQRQTSLTLSLPVRECGLKYRQILNYENK